MFNFSLFLSSSVLSHYTGTTEHTEPNNLCLLTKREVGSPSFYLKKKKNTCHKAMTSSGSWYQKGLQEPVSHDTGISQLNIASSCCNAARSVMESKETVGKVKRLPAKIGSDPDHPDLHLHSKLFNRKLVVLAKSTNFQLFAMNKWSKNILNSSTPLMFQAVPPNATQNPSLTTAVSKWFNPLTRIPQKRTHLQIR